MKPREIILPFITSVAIFSMLVCISCANQNRVDGEEAEAQTTDTTVGENGAPAPEGGNLGDLGELPPPQDGQAQANPDEPPPGDPGLPPSDQPPLTDNQLPQGDLPPPTDAELPPPVDNQLAQGDVPPAGDLPPSTDVPPGDVPPPADLAPVAQEPLRSESRPRYVGEGQVPKIPASAVKRGKDMLNRFYFVRKGDTTKSVAELLYGNASRVKELKRWNKGPFVPGRLIYYASAQTPEDPQMRSFYQERGVQPDEYQIAKGDTLGKIAKKTLRDARSWKEIAVVNGIEKPSSLETGQKLAIYPLGFAGGGIAARDMAPPSGDSPREARNRREKSPKSNPVPPPPDVPPPVEVPAPPPMAEIPSIPPPEIVPPPVAPPPPVAENLAPESFRKKTKKPGPGMDIANLIQQNLFFIVIGAGVSILLLALLAVNKKRKARAEGGDFNEDGFATPKARRR